MAEEAGGKEAFGPVVEGLGGAVLHDPAAPHQDDAIADLHRLRGVVRHNQSSSACLTQHRQRIGTNRVPEPAVQSGERLVHEKYARPRHDRAGQRHALLLTARGLVRIIVRQVLEPDARQRRTRFLRAGAAVEGRQPEHHVPQHGQMREERIILEHQADAALLRRHENHRRRDFAVVDQDTPGARNFDARRDTQQRRLPAAGLAEQRDYLARRNVDIDAFERGEAAVAARDTFERQARGDGRGGAAPPAAG